MNLTDETPVTIPARRLSNIYKHYYDEHFIQKSTSAHAAAIT